MNEHERDNNYESENSGILNIPAVKSEKSKGDIWLKIISVLIAVSIWFWVVGFESQVTQKKFTSIPVNIINASDMLANYGYSVLSNKEIYIDVTLEGKNSDLNRVKSNDIYAYVDLKKVTQTGDIALPIEIQDINYVHVADQSQSTWVLPIDQQTTKNVPVQGTIVQMAKESGVDIAPLSFNPATISVSGPAGVVNTIDHAQVNVALGADQPINSSRYVTQEFVLIDSNGNEVHNSYVKTSEISVEVYVSVSITKEVPLVVNYKYGYYNSTNTNIIINPAAILIKGSPDYLNTVNEISLGTIDEKKYENDTSVKMNIPMPDGVTNLSGITTADVEINFTDMSTRLMSITSSQFKVVPPKDFEYHIKEDSIQVKLLGPLENLNHVTSGGITVNVDLSNVTEKGTHSVPVDVVVTSDTSVFCVGEYAVNVEIY
ncbi:MAG: CdaR family protein [Oscillospiraceae bacterium]|nr:CdaR family protein [Oscillospiraceae bacterium]